MMWEINPDEGNEGKEIIWTILEFNDFFCVFFELKAPTSIAIWSCIWYAAQNQEPNSHTFFECLSLASTNCQIF